MGFPHYRVEEDFEVFPVEVPPFDLPRPGIRPINFLLFNVEGGLSGAPNKGV